MDRDLINQDDQVGVAYIRASDIYDGNFDKSVEICDCKISSDKQLGMVFLYWNVII